MTFRYGSVCSGIEAASVAWEPLGWETAFLSEIEPFPRAVLAQRFPAVPLHGDFTTIGADEYGRIELLVGGTPCQSFSVAGLRGGLDDDRGNLALEFCRLAYRKRPRWVVWENVPGVLSSNGGRDFGSILGALAEIGYGLAYRVLDAQYVRVGGFEQAVPQRRRRVFVVGYLGDAARAAAVLFDRESLSGHPAPRREAGQGAAPTLAARTRGGGGLGTDFDCDGGLVCREVSPALKSRDYKGVSSDGDGDGAPLIAHALRADGFDASEDGTGRGTPIVPIAIQERAVSENPDAGPDGVGCRDDGAAYTLEARQVPQAVAFDTTQITSVQNYSNPQPGDPCHPLAASAHPPAAAFDMRGREGGSQLEGPHETANIRAASGGSSKSYVADAWAVRRLTPLECERLQGFPDGWTNVEYRSKPAADGPRYKAIGNSMAVNVMRWIGERIKLIDDFTEVL